MLRFVADESLNGRVLRGLLRRIPDLAIARRLRSLGHAAQFRSCLPFADIDIGRLNRWPERSPIFAASQQRFDFIMVAQECDGKIRGPVLKDKPQSESGPSLK